MDDQIPIKSERSLLLGRQISKWSAWEVVFHENNSVEMFYLNTIKQLILFVEQ